MNTMRSTFGTVLSLALALSACAAPTPTPSPMPPATLTPAATPQVVVTRLLALLTGRLVLEGQCLRVQSAYGPESYLLVWAPDFEVVITGDQVRVADLSLKRQTTWRLGDTVQVGGGETYINPSLRPPPSSCAGPYWVISGWPAPSAGPSAPAPSASTLTPPSVTPSASSTSSATPTPTPAQPGVTQQAYGNVVTFTSTALGLSFTYQPSQRGATVATRVDGQRVYVYYTDLPLQNGRYVDVLPKAPGESLQQAIQQQILTGFDPRDCSLTTPFPGEITNFPHPPTLSYLAIQPRVPPTVSAADDDLATEAAQAQKCPQPYTMFGGSAYFMADSAHPDRFFFFKIGQDWILGAQDYPWQATLRVLDVQK